MNDIFEQVNCEIITKLLLFEEGEFIFSQPLLDYIGQNMDDETKKAFLHLNQGEIADLMICSPEAVMKARVFIPEMMNLLYNSAYTTKSVKVKKVR